MKKRQLNALSFTKEVISKFGQHHINGGFEPLKTGHSQENYCTRDCTGVGSCNEH